MDDGVSAEEEGVGRGARTRRPTLAERIAAGEVDDAEMAERARETVLRVLTAAPKSRGELAASLGRKGYPEHVVEPILDRFEEVGLIDDAEYAAMLVRTRHAERGLARRAIATELRRRGIPEEIAAEALGEVDDDSEDDAALHLARNRLSRTRGLDRDVRVRRAVGALARKGYAPGRAFEIVQRELDAEAEASA